MRLAGSNDWCPSCGAPLMVPPAPPQPCAPASSHANERALELQNARRRQQAIVASAVVLGLLAFLLLFLLSKRKPTVASNRRTPAEAGLASDAGTGGDGSAGPGGRGGSGMGTGGDGTGGCGPGGGGDGGSGGAGGSADGAGDGGDQAGDGSGPGGFGGGTGTGRAPGPASGGEGGLRGPGSDGEGGSGSEVTGPRGTGEPEEQKRRAKQLADARYAAAHNIPLEQVEAHRGAAAAAEQREAQERAAAKAKRNADREYARAHNIPVDKVDEHRSMMAAREREDQRKQEEDHQKAEADRAAREADRLEAAKRAARAAAERRDREEAARQEAERRYAAQHGITVDQIPQHRADVAYAKAHGISLSAVDAHRQAAAAATEAKREREQERYESRMAAAQASAEQRAQERAAAEKADQARAAHEAREREAEERAAREKATEDARERAEAERLARLAAERTAAMEAAEIRSETYRKQAWVEPGEFAGKRILLLSFRTDLSLTTLRGLLTSAGFQVDVRKTPGQYMPDDLRGFDQCWLVSGSRNDQFTQKDVACIEDFVKSGKGLYVIAGGGHTLEASRVCSGIHGATISGRYPAGNVVHGGGHRLFTGLQGLYEGSSVAAVGAASGLAPLVRGSGGGTLVAISTRSGERVVYDCGASRIDEGWSDNEILNKRWYQNVAAYLAGK